jgi:hypothetical protein
MNLNKFFDFMEIQNSIRKHPSKNEYFTKHVLFSTIYLLQEQKLNPKKYYEQEINMINYVQGTEHDVHMYAKFEGFTLYGIL